MPSTLGFGDKGPEVADLVRLLTTHGCAPRPSLSRSAPASAVQSRTWSCTFRWPTRMPTKNGPTLAGWSAMSSALYSCVSLR